MPIHVQAISPMDLDYVIWENYKKEEMDLLTMLLNPII
jgi:hypothetical protein